MNSKVIRLASIGLILVQAYSVQAATSTRADACHTYNVFGHQEKVQNGWDGDFCGVYVQVEHERKVKHTDSTPVVATEQPVTVIITVTPSPEPVLPIETPIACHDDEDDDMPDGEDDTIDDQEAEDCEDTDDDQ